MVIKSGPESIVVHPGAAHLDDFLSVCVALYIWDSIKQVSRREPTDDELNDPSVVCLDVGGSYVPELANFDHHQFSRDDEANCALSLLAKDATWHLADGDVCLHDAFMLTHWYPLLMVTDARGPFAAAKTLGVTAEQFQMIHANPLSGAILQLFGGSTKLSGTDMQVMRMLGGMICDFAIDLYVRINFELPNAIVTHEVRGNKILVLRDSNSQGLNLYRERNCPESALSVMYDDRGPGWTLYRFDDHPCFDFSKLESHPKVSFAHKGGFIAKTGERLSLAEVLELIHMAHTDATRP